MSCEIVAKTGRLLKEQNISVLLQNIHIDQYHIVTPVIGFDRLIGPDCSGEIIECSMYMQKLTSPDVVDFSLYLFKSMVYEDANDNEIEENSEMKLDLFIDSFIGIVNFKSTDFIALNTTGDDISYCKGIINNTEQGSINLITQNYSGIIYGVLFNEDAQTNFDGNQLTIKLIIKRD
jgi:hypothetical protein